jgi:putative ABC transport system permease protein
VGGTVLEGRAPVGGDEVLLGPDLARQLDVDVGAQVTIADAREASFTVVGVGLVPTIDEVPFGGGVWLAPGAAERAGLELVQPRLLARLVPNPILGPNYGNDVVAPVDIRDLGDAGGLGRAVTFVGLFLGVVVLSFVLGGIVRAQRRALSTARALGATTRQLRAAALVSGVVLTLPALVLGVLAGLLIGARFWSSTAADLPVVEHVAVPASALALLGLGGLAVAVLLSVWPAALVNRQSGTAALRRD